MIFSSGKAIYLESVINQATSKFSKNISTRIRIRFLQSPACQGKDPGLGTERLRALVQAPGTRAVQVARHEL